jgi:hypothetical protein
LPLGQGVKIMGASRQGILVSFHALEPVSATDKQVIVEAMKILRLVFKEASKTLEVK